MQSALADLNLAYDVAVNTLVPILMTILNHPIFLYNPRKLHSITLNGAYFVIKGQISIEIVAYLVYNPCLQLVKKSQIKILPKFKVV